MTINDIIADTLDPDDYDADASEPLEVSMDAEGEFVVECGSEPDGRWPSAGFPIVALLN